MQPAKMKKAMVMMVSALDTGKDPVKGELNLEETANGIKITGQILGLEPGTVFNMTQKVTLIFQSTDIHSFLINFDASG
jgi:hypothetical protein